jgi:NAD(P)-dependent dehydrogenase (short-subunit alcohol dehydrogenase family)
MGEKVFARRNALVIGGTGGIGRALARGLAERGASLIIQGGSSRQRLEAALWELRAAGAVAEGFLEQADLPGAAERILLRAGNMLAAPPFRQDSLAGEASFPGRLLPDILVCAWGPFKRAALEETAPEDWENLVKNNLIFPGTLISLSLNGMFKKGWGRILLFGGTNTDVLRGFTTTAAYSAAKTALGVLAKSVARSVGKAAVPGSVPELTCNVICPGLTDTEYLGEAAGAYNRERSPGGRVLSPGEVAAAALAVLENPGINGAVIPIDQGLVI